MPNFAVIEDGVVVNLIVADSQQIAEELSEKTCIEYTTESAGIGGTYSNGVFLKIKPYPSWILDENNNWKSPVEIPEENAELQYTWDETNLEWILVTP